MTQLWPAKVMKRYMHFVQTFKLNQTVLFDAYENDGDDYSELELEEDEDTTEDETEPQHLKPDCDDVF